MLTREYPPEVYGGAGVHVEYLARALSGLVEVTVHCQGADRPGAIAHRPWDLLDGASPALQVMTADLAMTAATAGPAIPRTSPRSSCAREMSLASILAAPR